MTGHEAYTLDAVNFAHFRKQLWKCYTIFLVHFNNLSVLVFIDIAIGIYILTKQHNFGNSLLGKCFYLCQNLFFLAALFTSAYIWHDTVRTEIVASVHDIDAGLKCIFPLSRKLFDGLFCLI